MATDPSELYDIRETQTIWHAPINVIVVEDEAAVVDNLMSRREITLKRAAAYRRKLNHMSRMVNHYLKLAGERHTEAEQERSQRFAAGKVNDQQNQQIFNLEAEIRGLEHTNALHLGIIDAQAARIKSLEAQLASLAPAIIHSATDNLG